MIGDVLVTGGAGRLGKALGALGARAPGRDALDITKPESLVAALEAHAPQIVINAAAYTDVEAAESDAAAAHAVNAAGAGHVAAACAAAGVPLIHISTDYVFGDGDRTMPLSETAAPDPLSVYGASKLAGEDRVRGAGGQACIVRVSWLFDDGPDTFIGKVLNAALTRETLKIVDDACGRPSWGAGPGRLVVAAGRNHPQWGGRAGCLACWPA